jgi:hypothetical protein
MLRRFEVPSWKKRGLRLTGIKAVKFLPIS